MKHKHKRISHRAKIFVVIATAAAIMAIIGAGIATVHTLNQAARLNRIKQIYTRLDLGTAYQMTGANVFGDTRRYEWDSSRTYSSLETFVVAKNVDAAVADVRKAIESEGFTYFEEPYPGSKFTELHFKSPAGEYIRLNVSSKLRDDAFYNANLMGLDATAANAIDANAGPATVRVKVNLNDNNE